MSFMLHPESQMVFTEWDWNVMDEEQWARNLQQDADGQHALLIFPTSMGVLEETLTPFSYVIFSAFDRERTVAEAVAEVVGSFDELPAGQEYAIAQAVVQQIRQCLDAGLLMHTAVRAGLAQDDAAV